MLPIHGNWHTVSFPTYQVHLLLCIMLFFCLYLSLDSFCCMIVHYIGRRSTLTPWWALWDPHSDICTTAAALVAVLSLSQRSSLQWNYLNQRLLLSPPPFHSSTISVSLAGSCLTLLSSKHQKGCFCHCHFLFGRAAIGHHCCSVKNGVLQTQVCSEMFSECQKWFLSFCLRGQDFKS